MNHFEAAPQILLYAYFPHKAEFDFSQETYETPVVFLLTAGSFRFRFGDGKPATAQPGAVIPCPAGCTFHRKALSPISLHMIKYSGIALNSGSYSISPRIQDDLRHLEQYNFCPQPGIFPLAIHYCRDILYTFSAQTAFRPSIENLLRFIDENFTHPLTNAELSKLLCCSEVSLIAHFKQAVGITPQQYLTRKRLQYAKQLLLTTDLSQKQISFECGYSDAFYFSRVFSRQIGVSPTQFRQRFKL